MQRNYVPLISGMMSTHYQDTSKADFRKQQILEQMSIGKANGLVTAKDILTTKLSQIRGASTPQEPAFYDLSGTGSSSKNQDTRFRKSSNNTGATSTKYRVDTTQPKWITNDRQVLRFYGYFQENEYDTLRTRRVVLCFYLSDNAISISEPRIENSGMAQGVHIDVFLEDDTLSVFEPRVKNSGVTGGRFLDRGRFRRCLDAANGGTMSRENQKERSAYCASDFYVGAIVRFEFSPNQRLELIEVDEQTLSYCESHPDVFLYSNIRAILQQLAISLSRNGTDLRREYRNLDQRRQRVISTDDLKRILHKIRLYPELNAQQLVTICRRYSQQQQHGDAGRQDTGNRDDVMIAYDEFCDDPVLTVAKLDERRNGSHSNHDDGWYTKLTKIPNLRNALQRARDPKNADVVPGDVFLQMMRFYHVNLSVNDLEELMTMFSRNGGVEYHNLCDRAFQSHSSTSAANRELPKQSQQHQQRYSDFDDFHEDDAAQFCEPSPPEAPRSPRKAPPQIPALKVPASSNSLSRSSATGVSNNSTSSSSTRSDPRVVELLQRVFGSRKYQLRKALRERDTEKSGLLGEEEFMDAVLSVEPKLSDDDTYLIADAYFPTNNCQLDYPKLLESAFRT